MRNAKLRHPRCSLIALALAGLLAGVAQASPTPYVLDAGPVASLRDSEPLEAEAAPDALEPGEFELLPGWDGPSAAPVMMLVSLNDQRAYVYRDGQPIAVTTVSTGQPGYDTPTGVFPILQKRKVHHSNRYKDNRGRPAAMPFMQRLTWEGHALHAGRVMPTPASHGCVRLPPKFAEQLFKVTRTGGTVVISEDVSVNSLARAGVEMPLAVLIANANSVLRIADSLVAGGDQPAPDGAGGAMHGTAFNP